MAIALVPSRFKVSQDFEKELFQARYDISNVLKVLDKHSYRKKRNLPKTKKEINQENFERKWEIKNEKDVLKVVGIFVCVKFHVTCTFVFNVSPDKNIEFSIECRQKEEGGGGKWEEDTKWSHSSSLVRETDELWNKVNSFVKKHS